MKITINDVLIPYIYPIDTLRYEALYTASWFEFYVSERHLDRYELYLNFDLVRQDSISGNFPFILVSYANLAPGNYKYTLRVYDESNNIGEQQVDVYITDSNPPFIVKPTDMILSEESEGHFITWDIIEANPHNYSLYHNQNLLASGILTGSTLITALESLPLGLHEYILIVYDSSGRSHTSSCYVAVVDITPPSITYISDCQFVKGDPNAYLNWEVFDLHPNTYKFYRNDIEVLDEGSWDGSDLMFRLNSWDIGIYELKITVEDTSGNTATDIVKVTILLTEPEYISKKSVSTTTGFGFLMCFTLLILIPFSKRIRKFRKGD